MGTALKQNFLSVSTTQETVALPMTNIQKDKPG